MLVAYHYRESLKEIPPASPAESNNNRYVIADNVRLRSNYGLDSEVYTQLSKGTAVVYTGNKTGIIDGNRWAEVEEEIYALLL